MVVQLVVRSSSNWVKPWGSSQQWHWIETRLFQRRQIQPNGAQHSACPLTHGLQNAGLVLCWDERFLQLLQERLQRARDGMDAHAQLGQVQRRGCKDTPEICYWRHFRWSAFVAMDIKLDGSRDNRFIWIVSSVWFVHRSGCDQCTELTYHSVPRISIEFTGQVKRVCRRTRKALLGIWSCCATTHLRLKIKLTAK